MKEIELAPGNQDEQPRNRERRAPRRTLAALAMAAALVGLAACGSAGGAGAAKQDGTGTATGAEPNAANGEGAAVRFTSSRFHYQVDAPGPMREAADGSAAYTGGTERLQVVVVTGGAATDPRGFATSDSAGLAASHPSYRLVSTLSHVTIAGAPAEKVVFSWTDGVNPVTTKPNDLVTARYYLPRNGSTLAVITYSIAAAQYDPQGADDVASTFKWL